MLNYSDVVKSPSVPTDEDTYIGWEVECAACGRRFRRGDHIFVVTSDSSLRIVCMPQEAFLPGVRERIFCLERLICRRRRMNDQDYLSEPVNHREVIFLGFIDYCEESTEEWKG